MYFSCFAKKSTKRRRHRGGAEAEPFDTFLTISVIFPPPSRPPLCTPPGVIVRQVGIEFMLHTNPIKRKVLNLSVSENTLF